MEIKRIAAILGVLLLGSACTTAHTYPTKGDPLAADVQFSNVAVSIDKSVRSNRLVMFRQLRGTHLLRDALLARLNAEGRIAPTSPYALEVRVVGVHVKTWFEALFNGDASSGEDYLTVDVIVRDAEEAVLQTSASASSSRAEFLFLHEGGRLENLSRAIAKVLTAEI